jgi:hypothetical protein
LEITPKNGLYRIEVTGAAAEPRQEQQRHPPPFYFIVDIRTVNPDHCHGASTSRLYFALRFLLSIRRRQVSLSFWIIWE